MSHFEKIIYIPHKVVELSCAYRQHNAKTKRTWTEDAGAGSATYMRDTARVTRF